VLSVNEKFSPYKDVKTVAVAEAWVECPEGKAGKGGSGQKGVHEVSITDRIYVEGRSLKYLYFVFQQQIKASATAMPTLAYVSAAFIRSVFVILFTCVAKLKE
jgi:hypothetical protein